MSAASPEVVGGTGLVVPPRLKRLDRAITWATELPAALLLVAEVTILFLGVVSRYVFDEPLVWADELASTLFLWLTMFGTVIALRRGEHMTLTAFVGAMSPRWRARCQALAAIVSAIFLLEIVVPALTYWSDELPIVTPSLGISDAWRVAALPAGAGLLLLTALARLWERTSLRHSAEAIAVAAAVGLALWFAQPWLLALGNLNLVVFFVLLVGACVVIGVPIAFAFGVATLSYLASTTSVPLSVVVSRMDEGMSNIVLLAVPLFVALGLLIEMTGLARALVGFMASLVGHLRGGLAYVLLGAMYLVSGISGSKAADMAAVAPVLFPEMRARGARPGDLVALLSASGAMAETIPPSIVLLTIGSATGVSIAALFTGGMLPAAVGAGMLVLVAYWRSRGESLEGVQRASMREVGRAFLVALPALVLPFVIRFAVVDGIATATEVSTIGVVYTVLVGVLIYRQLDWRRVYPMLVETAALSGAIMVIIGTATAMAWALTQSGFARDLVHVMGAMPGGKAGFLVVSIVVFVVLGSVLEGIPAIVLFGPLLFPAARVLGVNEVHYAMVVILAMGLGLFAPPFGVGFYIACAIGRVPPDEAVGRMWPYLGALLAAVILVAAIPWISIGFL
jgi:tripartite ATP-independent transporter DctM subunit